MLQSAVIPFGPLGRWVYRVTKGRHYARGNSSIVAFHPAHNYEIAERFREIHAQDPNFSFRPTIADERFISWITQPRVRAIPRSIAVKFPAEYMSPIGWLLKVRASLPWVRTRRAQQVAVTLCGLSIKPERLLALQEGDRVVDDKNRVLIWSQSALGPMEAKIRRFYADQIRINTRGNQ